MRRYLVTGCAGFMGSHLTETLLAAGHEVVGIDCFTDCYARDVKERNIEAARGHQRFTLYELDLADATLEPLLEEVDGVFHLAARTGGDGMSANLLATERLLKTSAAAQVRVVLASSSEVYGDTPLDPVAEHAELVPRSPAGIEKVRCEQMALEHAAEDGLDAVVLRYFDVYGPRQRPDMEFSRIIAALRGDQPLVISSESSRPRDVTYIDDAVDAMILAFHRAPRGMALNVGGGGRASQLDAIVLVESITGRSVPVESPSPEVGERDAPGADVRRIRVNVGWRPSVTLHEGLTAQIDSGLGNQTGARVGRPLSRGAGRPLVSVVVPVFNGGRYLRESLDSIVAQTYPQLEIIVVDDASGDETELITSSYEGRVAYHRQSRTRGQFDNVNDGIALARGDLIAVYHSDDVYGPEIVEREVDYLGRHPQVGAVFCKDVFIDAQGLATGRLELPPEVAGGQPLDYESVVRALLRYKNRFLRCPSSMVRAAVYREAGPYRPDLFGIASDLEMWLRIARRYPIGIVDEHLFSYRSGHGSLSDRYDDRRVEPERYFGIMDLELEHVAGRLVDEAELAAYGAYRAEDQLRQTVSNYVRRRPQESRAALAGVDVRQLIACDRVQRARLLALTGVMHGLVRLPWLPPAAEFLHRHAFVRRAASSPQAPESTVSPTGS